MILFFEMFTVSVVAAIVSFAVCLAILVTQQWHGAHTLDHDLDGVQKFHTKAVPRIGGLALFSGILFGFVLCITSNPALYNKVSGEMIWMLLVASIPAFIAGMTEDLTKKVSPRVRLLATMVSALLASILLGAILDEIDIIGLDFLFQFVPVALCFTIFFVAGGANAINIIDGFNGLAGCTVFIILAAFGYLSWRVGDTFVLHLALLGMGAVFGFLLVNYPKGRLFMGDGGAYFLGFWVSEIAVLLLIRNPEINSWQVLAICAYPVKEVLYSIYRRKFVRQMSPSDPDSLHLHTLFFRRIASKVFKSSRNRKWIANASVAVFAIILNVFTTLLAIWFGNSIPGALAVVSFQVLLYLALYKRIVSHCWYTALTFGQWPRIRAWLK